MLAALLIIGGMAFLIIGSNGIVIDHTNPFVHFSETTASQEITDGTILLVLGVACFVAFIVLFFTKRKFLFP